MAYDLLVKNGRIIDGSGMPAFVGDVAVRPFGRIQPAGQGVTRAERRTIHTKSLMCINKRLIDAMAQCLCASECARAKAACCSGLASR